MELITMRYGFGVQLKIPYEQAVARIKEALRVQGFGILTEIDVKQTLHEKLGVDFYPYVILGACNPPFAHEALEIEPHLGLLLPCNVVVFERDGSTTVEALDPEVLLGLVGDPALAPIAQEVRRRLEAAITEVAET